MKRIVLGFFATFILASLAQAQDRLDGCGLGWQVTDKKTYTATLTRGTTNAFVWPTWGMTTGTMGCDKLDVGAKDREASNYVATNFDSLKSELAMGRGEYVTALASALGCKSAADSIGNRLQETYSTVIAPAQDARELFQNIKAEVQGVCI